MGRLALLLLFWGLALVNAVVIETPLGSIRGKVNDRDQLEFLGVPYAEPPVGNLRWRAPESIKPWEGIYDATKVSPVCSQPLSPGIDSGYTFPPNTTSSEDCLYLNVWTPRATGHLPVMVWIHGGGLTQGGNSEYRLVGSAMSGRDVVVVVINYRLGVFGFLAHPDLKNEDPKHPSTGNYGLEDQRLALQWVQKHIHLFGGDPRRVTIMGESAGGTSVCLHLLMPLSKALFHQAICESSACFIETRKLSEGYQDTSKLLKTIGCTQTDPKQLLACMRRASVSSLLVAQQSYDVTAIIDGFNVLHHPWVSLNKDFIPNAVTLLAGNVDNEGTLFVYGQPKLSQAAYEKQVRDTFKEFAPIILGAYPCKTVNEDCRIPLSRVTGDFALACPTYFLTNRTSHHRPTYAYRWSHEPYFMQKTQPELGAYHSSEIAFVFSTFKNIYPYQQDEVELSQTMTSYWTWFGIAGNPNFKNLPRWPLYTPGNKERRQLLNVTNIHPVHDALEERCERLWKLVYNKVYSA